MFNDILGEKPIEKIKKKSDARKERLSAKDVSKKLAGIKEKQPKPKDPWADFYVD